ncbi:MAG TPA: glycosyltransferase family 39 protein, partial [Thermomicrobiales bacterium]|nr:glycosyltransferase family 39 protein [Thermomicrobiales bacterium]
MVADSAASASGIKIDVRVAAALAAILIAALGLRLYGLNWDDGRDLHPDELFIAKIVLIDRIHLDWPPDLRQLLDPAKSGLNPRSADPKTGQYREFAYGALPLWVTDAAGWALSTASGVNWNGPDRIYLVGRVLSALFDVGTVCLVFVLGRLLASDLAGLAAAAIAACAPISIQLAHFFTTDSWLTFFVTLCLVCSVIAARMGARRWFVAAGFALGLAMATKGSVFSLAVPVAVAALLDARRRATGPERRDDWRRELAIRLVAAGLAAIVGFALFEPYALMNPGIYLQSLRTQTDIVRGAFDVPFTRQYVGRPPLLYQAEQFGRWGFGPAATLLAIVGLVWMALDLRRRLDATTIVLFSWLVAYGAVIAIPEVRFLRYLAPLTPVFAVAAGVGLVRLACLARRRFGRTAARAVAAAGLAGIGLWAAAFASIYAHENPRLAASRWVYANIPAGSAVTAEYWDDGLPRDLGAGLTPGDRQYATVTMDLYSDQPPRQEANAIYRVLQSVDYVILSSNRVETGTGQAPWRYPVQQRYYEALRSGALGFTPVASFQQAPSLGPIVFDDRDADESFINYDHPRVEIYRKTTLATPDQYRQLMAPALAAPWSPTRHPPATDDPLLARPVGDLPVVDDVGWSAAVTGQALPALLVWIVLLVVLQAIGAPLARTLLPRFADGGWGLARLFAILLAGYLVWLGASVGLFEFRVVWCFVAVVVVGALALALRRRRTYSVSIDR